MNARTKRIVVSLTPREKKTLINLAEFEGRLSLAATIRHLLLEAARERGLYPTYEFDAPQIDTKVEREAEE